MADRAKQPPVIPLYPYQRAFVESTARFNWCCWARQVGKSFSLALRRLHRAILRGRDQIILSAGERQSAELMTHVVRHCRAMRLQAQVKHLEVKLATGARIIGLPANPRTIRGFTGDVALDEFAQHLDADEIWAAIFPTTLRAGGELDVASTPKGLKNRFARLADNAEFNRTRVTLPEAVTQGLQVDVEAARRAMGDDELYRQEYLCEFVDEATAFLTYELIAGCLDSDCLRTFDPLGLERETRPVYIGVDVGRKRDLTVIWPFASDGLGTLHSLGAIEMQNIPFREQYAALTALLRSPNVYRTCIDATGLGMQLAEAAATDFGESAVEQVTFSLPVKERLAGALRTAVQNRAIRVANDEAIRDDWHSVRRDVTVAGCTRYSADHTPDGHADRFWAAALAVHAKGKAVGLIEVQRGARLRSVGARAW